MSVEPGMTLSNITSNLETRSKVVVTKTKKLLEIRQGNMTFRKNSGRQPTTWDSVEDWKKWLEYMKFPDKIKTLEKRLTTPLGVPVITPSTKLRVGEVLSSEDGKSKVVVLKTGELLEVRRGDVTFTKRVKKTVTPKTWKTVEEWYESLTDEPESKRQKLSEYVESAETTVVEVKPYVEIHPRPFPTFESKYIWEERVRSKMTSELKKDMDEFVTEWVKKFKFE